MALSTFVVRATNPNGISDRTFSIDIDGSDAPVWNTYQGYLDVGVFGEYYALNNQWVDYQLDASAFQAPEGTVLKYYIANNDGTLPPGLRLSESGRITGFLRDKLVLDGSISATGGYDTEYYDGYTYDHDTSFVGTATDGTIAGMPKIYQFRVTVTDGVTTAKRDFRILVSSVDILRYNPSSMPDNITLPDPISTIQPLQWVSTSSLGVIRAENNQAIEIAAYDPQPLVGPVTYTIYDDGTGDILTRLPEGLKLDSATGYIYGFVPYQPAYTRDYSITVRAVKANSVTGELFTTTNTFSLAVKGEVESAIEWVTASNLGSIDTGIISELSVVAEQLTSNYTVKYSLIDGSLPAGLSLERDGSISGQVDYGSTGTYTFTVLASDVYELSSIERTFSLTVTEYNDKEYTKIYVRPFLPLSKRKTYQEFMSDEFTFEPSLMYRYYDPNFGVQYDIKMYIEFGIEQLNLDEYTVALRENFYRKRFYFGDVKLAVANDSNGNPLYEVVYVDAVDDMVNSAGVSASPVIYANDEIYYPGSVDNMRRNLRLLVMPDYTYISINEYNEPKFMRTAQSGSYQPPGFMRVIPLCYALPGQGSKIISRIKISGFDFKLLDFEVDRLIVQNSIDSSTAKYLILERQALGDLIETDSYLFGQDEVRVETENNDPIIRE